MKKLAIIFVLMTSPSFAADFSSVVLDRDGKATCIPNDADKKPRQDTVCSDGKFVTLAFMARNALNARYQDEPNLSPEDVYKRGELSNRLYDADPKTKPEEISLIKKLIGKLYNADAVFAAWTLLDK